MKTKKMISAIKRTTLVWLSVFAMSAQFSVNAQQVGTISVGDIKFVGPNSTGVASADVVAAFRKELNESLAATRKFTILGYSDLQTRLQKQGLTLQGFYDNKYDQVERSQVGLDYILAVNVIKLERFEQRRGAEKSGGILADLDYKLIGVADVTNDIASSVNAKAVNNLPNSQDSNSNAVLNDAVSLATDKLVDQVTAALHPIRVMIIHEDSSVSLNYGAGMLSKGDTILVYPEDQELKVGVDEKALGSPVATLQVTDVDKKFAKAQALEGFSGLERGQKGKLLRN